MPQEVSTPHLLDVSYGAKQLADYRTTLTPGAYEEVVELGRTLRGMRVLHLSATAFGGGVAEIMYTLMPLMRDVGLEPSWTIIHGADEFFDVTKLMHNTLQGDPTELSEEQREIWWRYQKLNADLLNPDDYDVVVVHDPQPLGVRSFFENSTARWIWRCHIDLSTPNSSVLGFTLPEMDRYDAAIFHRSEYVPDGLAAPTKIFAPAIDPLAVKNLAFSTDDAKYVTRQFGIDVSRPLAVQVSRFDPWKDPLGVIDAFRTARETVPGLQLALLGSLASDDPEGMDYLKLTLAHAQNDPDIHILSNLDGIRSVEVNAFQALADVLIQKSTREGFGLTVTEGLWKARPMIAGNVGGIRSQIDDGVTGYLVNSVDECAQRMIEALTNPAIAERLARAGKEVVRERFLTPRLLRDHLALYANLTS